MLCQITYPVISLERNIKYVSSQKSLGLFYITPRNFLGTHLIILFLLYNIKLCVCERTLVCVGQRTTSCVLSQVPFHLVLWNRDSHFPGVHRGIYSSQDLPVSPSAVLRLQVCTVPHSVFFPHRFWGSNSCLRTCTTSTSAVMPPPQP